MRSAWNWRAASRRIRAPVPFLGFFDFRSPDRLPEQSREQFVGKCKDVAAFVAAHAVNAIYIALPMSNAPRIEVMLHEFRDTTASIYFVPDIFAFDLVQARCAEIHGIPMLAICDTPFHGMNAVKKRAIDILLSSVALLLVWPVLLVDRDRPSNSARPDRCSSSSVATVCMARRSWSTSSAP